MKDMANKNINLCCHTDQTYENFQLTCSMIICLIQFIMLESVNSGSPKILVQKKNIYIATVIKLMRHFI